MDAGKLNGTNFCIVCMVCCLNWGAKGTLTCRRRSRYGRSIVGSVIAALRNSTSRLRPPLCRYSTDPQSLPLGLELRYVSTK